MRLPGNDLNSDDLNQRQGEILLLVVAEYIRQGQPVSSLHVTHNFEVGVSSATVRSVFADLEQKGYLYSPHRSAGRIPTEKAYRYFVEHMPLAGSIEDLDRAMIQSEYLKREFGLREILDVTCRILSILTNCAGVVLSPEPRTSVVKHIELLDMGEEEVLIVIVTRSGAVYTKTLHLETRIPSDYLQKISRFLNEDFKGRDLREIRESLVSGEIPIADVGVYYPMVARSISANLETVQSEEELLTAGLDRLYTEVAGTETGRIRDIADLFSSGEFLRGIFRKTISMDDVAVLIDGDRDERLAGLSIVTGSYKMGEKNIGSLGVIGPTRMDYMRTMAIVEYIRRMMSSMVTRMSN